MVVGLKTSVKYPNRWADDQWLEGEATFRYGRNCWKCMCGYVWKNQMVRHENNYSVLQYPVFSMTGPKVCITRWSATKTRTMIADDLDQIDIGRNVMDLCMRHPKPCQARWSLVRTRCKTTTRISACSKNQISIRCSYEKQKHDELADKHQYNQDYWSKKACIYIHIWICK